MGDINVKDKVAYVEFQAWLKAGNKTAILNDITSSWDSEVDKNLYYPFGEVTKKAFC
jgi:hypothetical protein